MLAELEQHFRQVSGYEGLIEFVMHPSAYPLAFRERPEPELFVTDRYMPPGVIYCRPISTVLLDNA